MERRRVRVLISSTEGVQKFVFYGNFNEISALRFSESNGKPVLSTTFLEVGTGEGVERLYRLTVQPMPTAWHPNDIFVDEDGEEFILTPVKKSEAATEPATTTSSGE